jgi:mRNA-degrading endonuclease RelE of RelBE toxin-antitoxin system
MPRRSKFTLTFAPEAIEHLDIVERKHHSLIKRAIDEQLGYTPEEETRNRKRLDQPAPYGATWELRCGPRNRFRVYYDVNAGEQTVWVLAIGVKKGNRLFIGGEEFQL